MISQPSWDGPADPSSRAVAIEVLRKGPISRSAIARSLKLSPPSLSRLTTPLIDMGLLVEVGTTNDGKKGRPSQLLDVRPDALHFVGIKLREKEIVAALTDIRSTVIKKTVRTIVENDPQHVVELLSDAVQELSEEETPSAIGIGVGGLVRDRSVIVRTPFLNWENVPLAELTTAATGIPTVIDNDVIAFTEFERWFGPARDDERFAVVTLGVATGFSLVIHGETVVDETYGLGLVGHWPLDPFGPVCPRGHRGCAYSILNADSIASQVSCSLGRPVTYDEALDLAADGQPAAVEIVATAGRGLGRLLAAICNLTLPQRLIIAGEGVRLAEVAEVEIMASIAADRDPLALIPPIELANGDNADWCRGAAALAIQSLVLGALPDSGV